MFMINSSSINLPGISIHSVMNTTDLAPNVKMPYPGIYCRAVDPIYGEAGFILAFGVASNAVGKAVVFSMPTYATTLTVAASRGLVGISMAANTSTTALSWYCVQGSVPFAANAAIAAGAGLYLTAGAGNLDDAVVANQAIDGAFCGTIGTSTTVTTQTVNTVNASTNVQVSSLDGLFVGATVTGTGIPASTTISAIGFGGQMPGSNSPVAYNITISNAATATGTVTMTVSTGTGFAIGAFNAPSAAALA